MKTRSFEVSEDGSEIVKYEYRGLTPEGGHRVPVRGTYCQADDVETLEQLLLAYRDGHSVAGSGRECFAADGYDGRCTLCSAVDHLLGQDSSRGALDDMLASLRSKRNGL